MGYLNYIMESFLMKESTAGAVMIMKTNAAALSSAGVVDTDNALIAAAAALAVGIVIYIYRHRRVR